MRTVEIKSDKTMFYVILSDRLYVVILHETHNIPHRKALYGGDATTTVTSAQASSTTDMMRQEITTNMVQTGRHSPKPLWILYWNDEKGAAGG